MPELTGGTAEYPVLAGGCTGVNGSETGAYPALADGSTGVNDGGAAAAGTSVEPIVVPQVAQNLAPAGTPAPHFVQSWSMESSPNEAVFCYQPLYPRNCPASEELSGEDDFDQLLQRLRDIVAPRPRTAPDLPRILPTSLGELTEHPKQPAGEKCCHRKRQNPACSDVAKSRQSQPASVGRHGSCNP